MKEVMYVLGLKTKLLSMSALDKKGYRVSFIDGQVLMCNTLEDVVVIGEEEGGLYKFKGHPETTLFHETTISSELWHRRFAQINYKALPYVRKVVTWLPYLKIKLEGTCKGCAQGKNIKNHFPKSDTKTKVTLELINYDVCILEWI